MIKVVMFDANGVLHMANTAVGDDIQQELGLTDSQMKRLFYHYFPLMGTGKMTEAELWEAMRQEFGIRTVDTSEHLFTRAYTKTLQKMPGTYELVDELKAKGIRVMLLTNVSPLHAEILEQQGHYDPFDLRILSFEVGSWKPDPIIYQHALEKAAAKPEEVVFIDDAAENIEAAKKLGIHGIVFKNADQTRQDLARLI